MVSWSPPFSRSGLQALLGLGVEEMQAVELDGDLELLPDVRHQLRLDLVDEQVVPDARVHDDFVAERLDDLDLRLELRLLAARRNRGIEDVLRPDAHRDLPAVVGGR